MLPRAPGVSSWEQAIDRYGLRVVCLLCRWEGRHWPKREGRLRHRPCPHCRRQYALKARWFPIRFPEKAAKLRRELLAIERACR